MSELLAVFVIATLGYLIGRITICGIDLGTAAVLLVALVFGHFGITTPPLVRDIGLVCFVTAVGFIAGPKFFRNFKQNAKSYVLLGFIIILVGALSCAAIILLAKLPTALGVGLMTGALTSTPGLAAAIEASGNDPMASIGYGIAYPFGVISVVLFVQLMPKILHVDVAAERKRFEAANSVELKPYTGKLFSCDSVGLFPFSIAIALGLLLAAVTIPLPGGAEFSLGTSGGPLIVAILIGRFGTHFHLVTYTTMSANLMLREVGITLFLAAVGIGAGDGFVDAIVGGGYRWVGYGVIITVVPLLIVSLIARLGMKVNYYTLMGLIAGSTTDPPALAYANSTAGNDMPAVSYATVYPVVMFLRVLTAQIFILFAL